MTCPTRVIRPTILLFLLLVLAVLAQTASAQTANWVFVSATGIPKPTTGAKPLYIYLASAGDIYIDDVSVVAGTVAGAGANLVTNGGLETGVVSPWTIGSTGNNSSSVVTNTFAHSGSKSLHLIASAAGTTQNSSIWQDFSSRITSNGVYTLSFWYRQTTNGGPLIVRFSGNGIATTNNPAPILVTTVAPPAGATVSNLTQIQVTFNKTVTNVAAENLLIQGEPATSVSGAGQNFIFTFSQPPPGSVHVEWDVDNGITDLSGNPFDPSGFWTYTLIDVNKPAIVSTFPAAGALVGSLAEARATFSKSVTGVTSSTFLINGSPAANVSGNGSGPYVFQFTPPPQGLVTFSWAPGQNIRDAQSNLFGGAGWTATLDSAAAAAAMTNVVLNEFLALNTSIAGLHDEDGLPASWIEIFNRGATGVSLAGWSLTDEADTPTKWIFPATNIAAGQYLVVFASGKDRRVPGAKLHTNFKLSASGDYLGLYNAELSPHLIQAFAPKYPEQRNDISYGLDNTNAVRYFAVSTPGGPNGFSSIAGLVAPLNASVLSGFFNAPFALFLTTATFGATIVYTTNGSVPAISASATNGSVYSGPINILQTTALRAVAFAPNLLPTLPLSRTYLFSEDIIRQPNNPTGYPTGNVWTPTPAIVQNGSRAYYQMDPVIVNDPQYTNDVRAGLVSIPTMSLMMPISDLFDATNGIYTHPMSRGDDWERACSMELIFPDNTAGAQADCGVQVQGGSQRDPAKNAKHSFRVTFKQAYGPGKFKFPMYADSPVTSFNTFVLDGGINYWWHYAGTTSPTDQRYRAQCVRDQFSSDLMAAMGNPAYHGKFFHLYLNGLYWGMNYVHERPDDDFAASYLGGEAIDYDVLKNTTAGTEIVAGDFTAWNTSLSLVRAGLAANAQYEQLQQYVDVDNLIDYMIVNHWVGNDDWPHHNWYVLRKRAPGEGFKFIVWDAEHVMKDLNINRTTVDSTNSPAMIYNALRNNTEFRLRFADHLQKHFFNNGVLYTDSANPIPDPTHPERNVPASYYMRRITEITNAIVDESARWGGYLLTTNYTRNDHWLRELNNLLGYTNTIGNTTNYFPQRSAVVLNQYKSIGLFPNVSAPMFNRFGGRVLPGFALTMTNQNASGTIYYTTNGADPRAYGTGAISSNALIYTSALTLNNSTVIKARVLQSGTWSALTEASFAADGPEPYPLAQNGLYVFTNWNATEVAGTFPPYMLFYQVTNSVGDPVLTDEMDSLWMLPYNLASRSRINGLGPSGFAFINTGNAQTNAGAGFVGAAVLALNTLGKENLRVTWTGGTITPNERVYAIRLQYRLGAGVFADVLDSQSHPVEYLRNEIAGHSAVMGPVTLPASANNQPNVQLRWKYYYVSGATGARAQLSVSNIRVAAVVPLSPLLKNATSDGAFHFSFNSQTDQSYQLEYKDDLSDATWTPLGPPVNGTGDTIELSDTTEGQAHRFYRLVALQ
jgi:hypothetical protein